MVNISQLYEDPYWYGMDIPIEFDVDITTILATSVFFAVQNSLKFVQDTLNTNIFLLKVSITQIIIFKIKQTLRVF